MSRAVLAMKRALGPERASAQKAAAADFESGLAEHAAVPELVEDILHSAGTPLDAETRAFFEPRFGHDFAKVRIHADARAAESAAAVHARAYTVGSSIAFARDHYQPATLEGRQLMAHELAHVVQQRNDGPSRADSAALRQPDDAAELEAHRIGVEVGRESRETIAPLPAPRLAVHAAAPTSIQRQAADEFFGFGAPKKPSNYETAGMIAAGGTPLKKSVESTHWNSEEEKREFIRDYIRYAKEHGLTKQYQDAIADYPDFDPDKPAAVPAAVTQYAQAQPAAPARQAPRQKTAPAIAKLPYRERPVASVQFMRLGFLGMEGLLTVSPSTPWIQKGPDPTAGYNFDVYIMNMEGGPPTPAQYLGGTRYRVLMGTPECPGCHFGRGLEVDLMGEHPLFIAATMALQAAPIVADMAAARATFAEEEVLAGQGKGAARTPGAPVSTADGTGTAKVQVTGQAAETPARQPGVTQDVPKTPGTEGGPKLLPRISATTEQNIKTLVEDSNPNFRLSRANAETALRGPEGAVVKVAGPGGEGADIEFRQHTPEGNIVDRREVKCIQGAAQGSFNTEVSTASRQLQGRGNVFVQVPEGSDGLSMVKRFRGARTVEQLGGYRSVTITIVNPGGTVLFDGPLAP